MYKIADDLSGSLHKEKEKRIDLKSLPKECNEIKPIVIKQGILKEVKNIMMVGKHCCAIRVKFQLFRRS